MFTEGCGMILALFNSIGRYAPIHLSMPQNREKWRKEKGVFAQQWGILQGTEKKYYKRKSLSVCVCYFNTAGHMLPVRMRKLKS